MVNVHGALSSLVRQPQIQEDVIWQKFFGQLLKALTPSHYPLPLYESKHVRVVDPLPPLGVVRVSLEILSDLFKEPFSCLLKRH